MKCTILVAAVLGGSLAAQDYLILNGFAETGGPPATGNSFPISRHRDLNDDGLLSESPEELFAFLSTSYSSTNSFMSDMDWVREGDNYAFYAADSSEGHITRGVDANNNGVLDNNEITLFFDFQSAFSPDGIAVWRDQNAASPQTIVYVAQDDGGSPYVRGIHRLVDLNGDGDATDSGEHSVFVDASKNLTVPNRAGSGTTTLVSHYWEQVHTLDDGTVIAYSRGSTSTSTSNNPDQFAWYAFTDNGGVASASVFFNPSRINDLPTHPAFAAGGQFPDWDGIATDPSTGATKPVGLVEYFAAAQPTSIGLRDYYFGASYNTGFIHLNAAGQAIQGLYYRWRDLDGDFRIGNNEITLFANFSGNTVAGVAPFTYQLGGSPVTTLSGRVYGMRAIDGGLHVCLDTAIASKHVFAMEDPNQNGVVETGEARETWTYQSGGGHVWSPQFGPFIKDFVAFDRGTMPGPFPTGLTPYGQGCADPRTGLAPVCGAYGGAPRLGNRFFALSVERVPPQSQSYLLFGLGQASSPLPPQVAPPGCNLLLALISGTFGPIQADASGVATLSVPVPTQARLQGSQLEVQWVTFIGGPQPRAATSNGLSVTLQ